VAARSQVDSAARRYRLSQLLDAYGDLLTEKQRTFLRLYFERDLSYGEIARQFGVSRQAIFDAVRHGEDSLERFESVLGLVESGWAEWDGGELTPAVVADRLGNMRERIRKAFASRSWNQHRAILAEMARLFESLTIQVEPTDDEGPKRAPRKKTR